MAHAIWKGTISFGLVEIPVGLYSAENQTGLHFNMLDKRDLAPVGYQRINKSTGEPVDWEQIVKGYEIQDGQYVIVTDEDFKKANVEATETVDIVAFVDGREIDSVYYDKPYYLAPLSRGGKAYALLRETLRRSGKVGIAKVVIRTRQYIAAVTVREQAVVLNLLRYAHELRDASDLDLPGEDLAELGVSARELELAARLVAGMVAPWDPTEFHDEYHDDLLALIEKKAAAGGAEVAAQHVKKREGAGVVDIMELLKKSVQRASANEDRPAGARGAANVDREPRKATHKRAEHKRPRRTSGARK